MKELFRTYLENNRLWEGRVKPGPFLWEHLKNGNLKPESAILQPRLSLIDGRPKPDHQDGQQRYEDDEFMEEMIGRLRRKGKIQRQSSVPEDSRFCLSPWEIEDAILPELARRIGKAALGSEGRVVNNSYMIFNIVGNMRHPEWHKTNTGEWFGDNFGYACHLFGGFSDYGGLADVRYRWSGARFDGIGFRPLIVFPSKT